MNVVGVILAIGPDPRIRGLARPPRPRIEGLVRAAFGADLEEVVVVIDNVERMSEVPEGATVLLDGGASQASALRAAVDWCTREGHEAMVLATLDAPIPGNDVMLDPAMWQRLATTTLGPLVAMTFINRQVGLFRIEADIWPILPLDGAVVAQLASKVGLLRELEVRSDEGLTTTDLNVREKQ